MKRLITAVIIATCLALDAAAWPQTAAVEETPLSASTPTVAAPGLPVAEVKLEAEIDLPTEKEKAEIPQSEPLYETSYEPETTPLETLAVPEVQPVPEPKSIPEPATVQTAASPQPGDMVYVEGFGWLECHGPGQVTYAENMYENGNKIGIMG